MQRSYKKEKKHQHFSLSKTTLQVAFLKRWVLKGCRCFSFILKLQFSKYIREDVTDAICTSI